MSCFNSGTQNVNSFSTAQLMCLETVALMGALYLEPRAECNLGVGHFHEVAWSPYHLSQKASYMKYETQQLGNTYIFQQPTFW